MTEHSNRLTGRVLGAPIDALDWAQAVERLMGWARARESRYVCICNAHVVVTARQEPAYGQVLENADMNTPDGAPVAWALRQGGFKGQGRISGPDLMPRLCEEAAREGVKVLFYGSTDRTLALLREQLSARYPGLEIVDAISPPFRALSEEEDRAMVERINASGAGLIFVGLGCPKQEFWMATHRGAVSGVMLGVGAAFDFHAGTVKRAPQWMQDNGLEWLHRLCSEPRRLWKRYFVTNTLFVLGMLRQLATR